MINIEKYPETSKKICAKVHDIVYDWKLDDNQHWNRATFSSEIFLNIMKTIEELFFREAK